MILARQRWAWPLTARWPAVLCLAAVMGACPGKAARVAPLAIPALHDEAVPVREFRSAPMFRAELLVFLVTGRAFSLRFASAFASFFRMFSFGSRGRPRWSG